MANDGTVKIGTELDKSGLEKGLSGIGNFAKKGAAVFAGTAAAGVAAFGAITKVSLDAVAQLEQNVGGVETLFKDSAQTVIDNANKAYKTAGMSANSYMSTVTSFSASLLQSLSGNTAEAAKVADMAIVDMSDNANKMGTSIERIQDAYQGFAKQNYTMLDNLKLGYGGTKTEMERLLADAQELSGVKYDISNLSDVYQAIHVIQTELGITGTTAKEAATTIEGSMNSAKAAWQNFLAGTATAEELVSSLGTAASVVGTNLAQIIPRLAETIPAAAGLIANAIVTNLPQFASMGLQMLENIATGITNGTGAFLQKGTETLNSFLTTITNTFPKVLSTGTQIISNLLNGLISAAPTVIRQAGDMLVSWRGAIMGMLPSIISAGGQMISSLLNGLVNNLPSIIQNAAQVVVKYAATILQNLPQILQAGIELIGKLLAGIIQAVPKIISAIPGILANIAKTFLSYDWLSIGTNIISGIASGVASAASNLVSAAVNAAKSAIDTVKGWLGIHSPSRRARDEIGVNMIAGVSEGVEKETPQLEASSEDSAKSAVRAMRKASASEFVSDMQSGAYRAAENNEMAARSKVRNNGYDPDNSGDETLIIHNEFNVDGDKLVEKTVKKTKRQIEKEQRAARMAKGDVAFA